VAEINLSLVLDAITVVLDELSPDSSIYIDKVEQGLNDGDFLVRLINTDYLKRGTGELNRVVSSFDIIYFPKNGNKDCICMGDKLSELLSVIKLSTGDTIRAVEKSFEIVDSILHFRVSHNYSTIKYQNVDNMGRISLNRGN